MSDGRSGLAAPRTKQIVIFVHHFHRPAASSTTGVYYARLSELARHHP